jgi:ParB/RepB/Spo0J family partition protein
VSEAEIRHISRKYESFRLRDANREKYLLQSILEHGVRKPLQCVQADTQDYQYVLLDGFKRLRCCCKLQLSVVPVISFGTDEAGCILHLLRASNERNLSTLEQARFVDQLHSCYRLSVGEIADALECSKAWVSVRLGIIGEMSRVVREAVFSDRFPLRSYMYTLRRFTRVNSIPATAIDRFVTAVAGNRLSNRDVDRLAYGYFRGGERLQRQIEEGNLEWTLRQMKNRVPSPGATQELSEAESTVIRDLELAQKYLSRLQHKLSGNLLHSKVFRAQASLLAEGLLGMLDRCTAQLKELV